MQQPEIPNWNTQSQFLLWVYLQKVDPSILVQLTQEESDNNESNESNKQSISR